MYQPQSFFYHLPDGYIAQTPANPRDSAKLMLLNRQHNTISHHIFSDLPNFLTPNDVLVVNNSKVFPARLNGHKDTGGQVEVLLLHPKGNDVWQAIARGVKTAKILHFTDQLKGYVLNKTDDGEIDIRLESTHPESIDNLVDQIGQTPIPPYISSPLSESTLRQEYQTIYAKPRGSAAAPTAGMHFTPKLLTKLRQQGVQIEEVTLHVGLGTFSKLHPHQIASGKLHHEYYSISQDTADRLNQAKLSGKRIVAVGTTTCRVLESASVQERDPERSRRTVQSGSRTTDLFIMPPYQFQFTDALITNFHLPESSLLMLVTAFCGDNNFKDSLIGRAYQAAVDQHYRFFSFGDAMMIE